MTTRGRGTPRRCPIVHDPGATGRAVSCGGTVRAGHLMCAPHWRRVPADLRSDVWAAWRRWQRTGAPEVWDEYLRAREAAISAVTR